MQAFVGDEITIAGHIVGEPKRVGQIVEVRGDDGAPPYRVRWDDSGRTTLLFPGHDATIKHMTEAPRGATEESVS